MNLPIAKITDYSKIPFERRVDQWLREQLIGNSANFHKAINNLPGVYPTAALASLKRLYNEGYVPSETYKTLEFQATKQQNTFEINPVFPLPHPINFEWRFTKQSSLNVLNIIQAYRGDDDLPIMYFGTPGVAFEALRQRNVEPAIFIGEDNAVTELLAKRNDERNQPMQIQRCGDQLKPGCASTVVMDPPWYMDFIKPMLVAATQTLRMNGFIQFSMPPVGTGRSAYTQRQQIFEIADNLGLDVVKVRRAFLRYETPFFEANALRASGLSAYPDWRCGDLVTFVKRRANTICIDTRSLNAPVWREAVIGRMRLYIAQASNTGEASLQSIVQNDILPSVSRKHPLRSKANVWTSGNRMFYSDNTDLLFLAATITSTDINTFPFKDTYKLFPEKFDELLRVRYKLHQLSIREAREEEFLRLGGSECGINSILPTLLTTSNTTSIG